ncbi:MAG: tetratricopeptide repeat protein [Sphingomonas sp.]|nr:tetratricopeptide repeat protein [Sphingomonas sp.]
MRGGKEAPGPDPSPSAAPAESVDAIEARTRAAPTDPAAWARLGEAKFVQRDYPGAVAAYERAVQFDARAPGYWSALGEARVMASEQDPMPPAALDAFDRAIKLDAKDPRARYFLAVARDLRGDHDGAIADWLALLEDTPPGAPWEADLKRTIEQVGRIHKIDVASRIAAVRQPAPSIAAQTVPGPSAEQLEAAKGMTPSQQDQMAQGMVASLEAKLKADPSNVEGWLMLIRSRTVLGERDKAAQALRDAVKANPGAKAELEAQAGVLGVR